MNTPRTANPFALLIPAVLFPPGLHIYCGSLKKGRRLVGSPRLEMWIRPSKTSAQIIAHLYEINRFGLARLITHGPITVKQFTPGSTVHVSFDLKFAAYDIPNGHSLGLCLDTFDTRYAKPVDDNYSLEILYDAPHTSRIHIPFLDWTR